MGGIKPAASPLESPPYGDLPLFPSPLPHEGILLGVWLASLPSLDTWVTYGLSGGTEVSCPWVDKGWACLERACTGSLETSVLTSFQLCTWWQPRWEQLPRSGGQTLGMPGTQYGRSCIDNRHLIPLIRFTVTSVSTEVMLSRSCFLGELIYGHTNAYNTHF